MTTRVQKLVSRRQIFSSRKTLISVFLFPPTRTAALSEFVEHFKLLINALDELVILRLIERHPGVLGKRGAEFELAAVMVGVQAHDECGDVVGPDVNHAREIADVLDGEPGFLQYLAAHEVFEHVVPVLARVFWAAGVVRHLELAARDGPQIGKRLLVRSAPRDEIFSVLYYDACHDDVMRLLGVVHSFHYIVWSMGKVLLPSVIVEVEGPVVFLAGPIQGAPDWLEEAARILSEFEPALTVASPRALPNEYEKFDEAHYRAQVDWETHYLRRAAREGVIMFWLAKEKTHIHERAYAQTSRFEIGRAS